MRILRALLRIQPAAWWSCPLFGEAAQPEWELSAEADRRRRRSRKPNPTERVVRARSGLPSAGCVGGVLQQMHSPRAHSTDRSRPGPPIPELTPYDFAPISNANFLPQCRVRQGRRRAIRVQEAPPAASAPFVQRLDPINPPASENAVKILQSSLFRSAIAHRVTRPFCSDPETLDASGPLA